MNEQRSAHMQCTTFQTQKSPASRKKPLFLVQKTLKQGKPPKQDFKSVIFQDADYALVQTWEQIDVTWEPSHSNLHLFRKRWNWWKRKVGQNCPGIQHFFPFDLLIQCSFHYCEHIHDQCVLLLRTQPSCHAPNIPTVHFQNGLKSSKTTDTRCKNDLSWSCATHLELHYPIGIQKQYDITNGKNLQHVLLYVITSNLWWWHL